VKYSSPNSVSGRFPGFDREILSKSFPAYAYISATAPNAAMDGSLGEITTLDADNVKLFLRLYDTGFACFVYFINFFKLSDDCKQGHLDSKNQALCQCISFL